MKVVIVAKTRMGSGACIGAVSFEGRSLRLLAPGQDNREGQFNLEYNVGDVWDITCEEPPVLIPPHIESVVVTDKRKLPPIDDICQFIDDRMPPVEGGIEVLFEGLTQSAPSGALTISGQPRLPQFSTMFWRTDRPLALVADQSVRIRYRYSDDEHDNTLTFVGFQEPVDEIPAGTIVRVSLAHWWRPDDKPEEELRCYVQLSGWVEGGTDAPGFGNHRNVATPLARQHAKAWDLQDAEAQLHRIFGYESLRPAQSTVIENLISGQDTIAIMPTGSGKSLCYQLPATLFAGLTVVVSPLIALMEDQVVQLRELDINAAYLNSTLRYEQQFSIMHQVRAGGIDLLYVSPETLLRPEILRLLDEVQVDCLAIDEAHCISEWGHDFRPEYRQLGEVRRRFANAACLALTATATQRVREDIRESLGISKAAEVVTSFNRDNLFLVIRERRNGGWKQLIEFLQAHKGQSGLIYCLRRQDVDRLTADLQAIGLPAIPYHAGLDDDTRRLNHRRFVYEEDAIVVATIAFGMGINKSNVRFVVHFGMPKDIESYYQQIGRAGRDGLQSDCLLLFGYQDMDTANYHIGNMSPGLQPPAAARLRAMTDFTQTNQCRRRPLLGYFDEAYEQQNCGMCDNCLSEPQEQADLTIPAQKFLSCVKRTGEMFGASHIIDVLRGSRSQKVLSKGHDKLSTYGIGREFSKEQWYSLARQFLDQGLLRRNPDHGGLSVTDKGVAVLRGTHFSGVAVEQKPQRKPERILVGAPASAENLDNELFELLRTCRAELAEAQNVPAYVIINDRTLMEMASFYPQTHDELLSIHGIGDAKADKYGAIFLEVINEYCQVTGKVSLVDLSSRRPAPRPEDERTSARREAIVVAFEKGQSMDEIATALNINKRTVVSHLEKALKNGNRVPVSALREENNLPDDDLERVLSIYTELGADFLRPVYEELDERIGYDDLNIARLIFLNEPPSDETAPIPTD